MEKTKIDIISGFLGAGKTTLIKKLLKDAFQGEQVVLIENEFGEIGIDGGFLKEAGIQIREMNSGCICCSLVGDFGASLKEVISKYHPDRILIEPSGVGKLSDVIKAVQGVEEETGLVLNSYTTVVDAKKCKMYMRNFGEFFNNQVEYAGAIIMSRTDIVDEAKAQASLELLREINSKAAIITTPIEKLEGKKLLEVMEHPVSLADELMEEEEVCPECDMCMNMANIIIMTMMKNVDADMTTIMKNMSIIITTMMKNADADMTTIMKNMSIIITTMIMNADADMTTIMKSMSIIITTMIMNADVDTTIMTITIIMQMKYLQVGVVRQLRNIQKKILRRCWKLFLHLMNMESFSVQKECFRQKMEHGFILIWFRKKQKSVKAHRNIQVVSA